MQPWEEEWQIGSAYITEGIIFLTCVQRSFRFTLYQKAKPPAQCSCILE